MRPVDKLTTLLMVMGTVRHGGRETSRRQKRWVGGYGSEEKVKEEDEPGTSYSSKGPTAFN